MEIFFWDASYGNRSDSPLPGRGDLHSLTCFIRKGIAWLLLALIAEAPPVVGLSTFLALLLVLIISQLFLTLNLNGNPNSLETIDNDC